MKTYIPLNVYFALESDNLSNKISSCPWKLAPIENILYPIDQMLASPKFKEY